MDSFTLRLAFAQSENSHYGQAPEMSLLSLSYACMLQYNYAVVLRILN